MQVGEIRVAIADAVRAGVPSLNCFGYLPESVPEPCFYTGEVEQDFDRTFRRGMDELDITCRVLVSRADDRAGQQALDRYVSGSGTDSVKAAIEAARGAPGEAALDGLCDDLHVRRVQGYRYYLVGEVQFFGAELIVHVIGEG